MTTADRLINSTALAISGRAIFVSTYFTLIVIGYHEISKCLQFHAFQLRANCQTAFSGIHLRLSFSATAETSSESGQFAYLRIQYDGNLPQRPASKNIAFIEALDQKTTLRYLCACISCFGFVFPFSPSMK